MMTGPWSVGMRQEQSGSKMRRETLVAPCFFNRGGDRSRQAGHGISPAAHGLLLRRRLFSPGRDGFGLGGRGVSGEAAGRVATEAPAAWDDTP